MYTFSLKLLTCFCLCASVYAQDAALTNAASVLFENSLSTLSNAEKNEILQLTGFALAPDGTRFYLKDDPDSADAPFEVRVLPLDLNNDGIEEIAIEYGDFSSSRKTDVSTVVLVKNMEGRYSINFGHAGTVVFLNINPLTLPDTIVRSRKPGFPVWRWNGMKYVFHEQYTNKKLNKMRITYLETAHRSYIAEVRK